MNASQVVRQRRAQRWLLITAGLMILLVGVGIGYTFGVIMPADQNLSYSQALRILNKEAPEQIKEIDFKLFWEVWELINKKYVNQPVDTQKLFYGALAGLVVGVGDPYSMFFTPEQAAEFLAEIQGDFEGIGAEIGIKDEQLTVVAPLAGSPAEQVGLMAGDKILFIDDMDTKYMTINQAVGLIRGNKGTKVKLTVQRRGEESPQELEIERRVIHVDSVTWETVQLNDQTLAVVTISGFNSDTASRFQEVVNFLLLEKPSGIILDLRNNTGGFLDIAVDVASKFIPTGETVVIEQAGDGSEKIYAAKEYNPLKDILTVVLINGGTASAAEIVAGALQDHDRGTLIGETSFGKGTVQDLQTFSDGSSLKLTIARWLTPSRQAIDQKGIEPDYAVARTAEDVAQNFDPQLSAAQEFLTTRGEFLSKFLAIPATE